jgi:DNA-binding transcriptional LysR family regulator
MASPSFDPALLSTFLEVIETGRISAAAKSLHLSQPAVTAQVRRLEESLGAALFIRSAQGVTPTDAGRRLVRYARSVRDVIDQATADLAAEPELAGSLTVAASTTIAAHILPPLLAGFRALHREMAFKVHVVNTEHVIAEVRAGRVPLGLVEGHARAQGVRLEPFFDDEIVAIMGRDAPFRVERAQDLDQVPILWREAGAGTRAVVERALRRAGLGRRKARRLDIELGSTEAVIGGAMAGLGVAFVSRSSLRMHLASGVVRIVAAPHLTVRRTFRWTLPPGALTGTAARFYDYARRTVATAPPFDMSSASTLVRRGTR